MPWVICTDVVLRVLFWRNLVSRPEVVQTDKGRRRDDRLRRRRREYSQLGRVYLRSGRDLYLGTRNCCCKKHAHGRSRLDGYI